MIANLYRKHVPPSVRDVIYEKFLGQALRFKRDFRMNVTSKFFYSLGWLLPKTEKNRAYAFMGKHGLTSYPGAYMLEYKNKAVEVLKDTSVGMSYVLHNGRKLFFPNAYSEAKIIRLYRSLITEQDERAAHRYVKSYNQLKGLTLLDIGSAEGIFSLDTIELVNHVYLFECEDMWIAPLEATFAPWKDKVTLVRKYVSDKTDDINITIDEFLRDKPKDNLFLKMDIEGAEQSALRGASNTLKNGNNIHLSVCTYHKPEDPEEISKYLASHGYRYEYTDGLMHWGKRLSKGIIRSYK